MPQSVDTNKAVSQYYSTVHELYQESMDEYDHRSIHYGYFDAKHTSRDSAVENMTRVLAETVDIDADDRVLHCGCGIGGPATWIAKHRGAEVVGLNITESQLEHARSLAETRGVSDHAEFRYDDFTAMETVDDNAFDVVWGLEAICYAENKRDFLEEAYRVLDDDGRIVVADGYRSERDLRERDEQLMRKWLDGWKVPDLAHVDDFRAHMEDIGFEEVTADNIDEHVLPFSRGTFMSSFPRYVLVKLREQLGRGTPTEVAHVIACHYQYRTLRQGLWSYNIVHGNV
ncbi:hypothetical protein C5B90_04930 [Haloferax sp. Atlit-12N]|uniref:SAM-dependent methyltransferase n=1 Tax=Haloferax sp. Atlit-12N TaxID=2077203 RepID=UPI000E2397CA|nr:methyltransferase domain-containing protein [Haloferax sp. Atlit-12N]RDZ65702.1 hypothetical protein C5B90_04930 [Haloferax sp. Atlit-12N]